MRDVISLREGDTISCKGDNWRIIHVEDMARVLASRIQDGRHEFLKITDILPPILPKGIEGEGSSRRIRSLPQGKLTLRKEQTLERTQREYQYALKYLEAPRTERRKLVEQMAQEFGYNKATAYRRIALIRAVGKPEALLRAVRSDAGKRHIGPEVIKLIRDQLGRHRNIQTPKTLPRILDLVNGECRKKQLPDISLATLRSFDNETTFKQKLEAQGRKKKSKDLFRLKKGHLPNKDYPLAIIQVDHTPLQICLVDEADRKPINDPWLTLVIDTYSRMVLGFFLTFDAPSTLSTGMALAHAFLPKEDYLHTVNVEGDWPCWGFPDIVLVDNATELNGQMMHGARKLYRFTLRDRPVGSPNFGGHVESAFKTFMHEFKSIPGTKFSNPYERGEYDSEGNAIFTISEFEAFFTEFLVNDYHVREHTGDGMNRSVPLLKWKQGILEGDSMPPTGLPDLPADPLALRISLMPYEFRTIEKGIVKLNSVRYSSNSVINIGDKVDLKHPLDKRKFEVRYDPRDLTVAWLYDTANKIYVELTVVDILRQTTLWELRAFRKRRDKPADQFANQRFESLERREEMKVNAARKTKQQRLEAEKLKQRAKNALIKQPPPPTALPVKQAADHSRLQRMMSKVRTATLIPDQNDEENHEN